MKTIITILTAILLLSCISAINVQAGGSYSFILNEQYSYYKVTGNQTEVDLTITQIGNNVTIDFGKYTNDTFTITFYNWKDEVVIEQQRGGGGSSYTKKKFVINETIDNEIKSNDLPPIEKIEDESDLEVWTNAIEEKSSILIVVIVILLSILVFMLLKNVAKNFNKNKKVEKFNEEILNNKQGEND